VNEAVTAWTPLIVALLASGTALAAGIGPTVRYARLEKLLNARNQGEAHETVDLLIDVLASGLVVEENSVQQRTRIWWAFWTGVLFVASAYALFVGWGVMTAGDGAFQPLQLAGLAGSLVTLPLFIRSLWALFRPRPVSLLIPAKGIVDRRQAAVRTTVAPPTWKASLRTTWLPVRLFLKRTF